MRATEFLEVPWEESSSRLIVMIRRLGAVIYCQRLV